MSTMRIEAAGPTNQIVSLKPVVLDAAADRGADLEVRVSAAGTGTGLPVVVFSHGMGWSMDAYAPLVDYWAARGFVVVQPTHLDSRLLGLAPDDPRFPGIWLDRLNDLTRILDGLDTIVAAVPGLAGRVDTDLVAAAGHSWGAQTVGMLLGATVLDSNGVPGPTMSDCRVRAGLLLSPTGTGGSDLTPFAAEHLPFMSPDFTQMTVPTLVVAGDSDQSALSTRGPDWFTDAFTLSPGPKALYTVFGGEHSLGGISGHAVAETSDENPEAVAAIQLLTCGYLLSALGVDPGAWSAAKDALAAAGAEKTGQVQEK